MRLFVDDLRICPEGWECARTNTDAIRLLYFGHVEEISIDHDIVKCMKHISPDFSDETFQPVFYYITAMSPESRPKKITIHTANPAAATRMEGLFEDHGIKCVVHESGQPFPMRGQ
jgi:hypothetical protein